MSLTGCGKYRSSFSAYLDGAVSGKQMQSIAQHLDACNDCRTEFNTMREIQRTLALLGPAKAPSNMGTRLRVAISHEAAGRKSTWRDTLSVRWDNAFRPLLVQVSAGFASSVAFIGGIILLLGAVAAPSAVMANDEPIMGGMTAPHYRYSAVMPRPIIMPHDTAIVVEAMINDQGRVYDYKIVSGPEDQAVQNQIVDQLTMSVFEPAKVFGTPVRGRVILTFAGISVQA
jgi:hypothetical protein